MKRPTLPMMASVLFVVSSIASLLIIEFYLAVTNYQFRPHNWIFQNTEFYQDSSYYNFFTLDRVELFVPCSNTLVSAEYWQTDQAGFR